VVSVTGAVFYNVTLQAPAGLLVLTRQC